MLTDLSWLGEGRPYPPPAEKNRIKRYKAHEQLFLSRHDQVWKEDFDSLARLYRKRNRDVTTVLNYHQLLSKKTADFVCGEPPTIETEADTDKLLQLLALKRFNARLYEGIIDVSRYGDAVFKLVGRDLSLVAPQYWFPVVSPTDLKRIEYHVVAYPVTPDKDGAMTELYVEIHTPGRLEQRLYGFDEQQGLIGKLKQAPHVEQTGLDESAVQILTNVTHSGSIYGLDDYEAINSIVRQLMWRLHCGDTVLDKHSEPSMSGPASALEYDAKTGMYFVNLGNYFKRDSEQDPDMKYITWDGNLESNFKEIDLLFNQLYILTEMGQAFLEGGGGGEASSGTALKLRMVSPRIKAARLVGLNQSTVKTVICMLAQVNGLALEPATITLHWNDGLPDDEVEQINTLVTATGGLAVMSQYAALKQRGLSDAEVEAELEQMATEQATAQPVLLSTVETET